MGVEQRLHESYRRPLVGREVETARLHAALERLAAGVGGHLEIAGEPGIGKTRLAAALCESAAVRGVATVVGRATAYEQAIPFHVFVDALGDRLAAELPELPDLLPEPLRGGPGQSAARRPTGPEAAGSAPYGDGRLLDVERFRLYRRIRALLARWASGGLLLVLEDLHWADPASAELAEYLVRHPVPGPLLLVLVHRPRQTSLRLLDALSRAQAAGLGERLAVGPLSQADAGRLLGRHHPAADLAARYRESGGNPLYLLALDRGDAPPDRWAAPLLGEVAALPPADAVTLAAAAVLGDPFPPAALAAVADQDPADALAALGRLAERDLVRQDPGATRFCFRHPVLRAAVYEHTEPAWRTAAHRRALRELTRTGGGPAERARHAECALPGADPVDHRVFLEAADDAVDAAPAAAAAWLRLALAGMPDTPESRPERAPVLLRLVHALGLAGRLGESRALLHRILDEVPADPAGPRTAAVALCGTMERMLGHYAEAEAMLRGQLALLPAEPPPDAFPLLRELSVVQLLRGDVARATPTLDAALGLARRCGDPAAEAAALGLRGFGEVYLGRVAAACDALSRAAELADGLSDRQLRAFPDALAELGWGEAFLERYTDAERHLVRGEAVARLSGRAHVLPHFLLGLSHTRLQCGRIPEALAAQAPAEQAARDLGSGELLGLALALKSIALAWSGPARAGGRAVAVAEEAVRAVGGGTGWWSRVAGAALGHALLMAGRPQQALHAVQQAGGGAELSRLQPTLRPQWFSVLVAAALRVGDIGRAEAWAARSAADAAALGLAGQYGFAWRARAAVAAARRDPEVALALSRRSAESFAAAGMPVQRAWTLVGGAASAAECGRTEVADAWLDEGAETARGCGAARVGEQAERERRRLCLPGGRRPQTEDRLDALTDRERQIASLVSSGQRTKEIAAQLCLSPRTVDAHLARIYRKLDITSRAALAAMVGRGGAP